MFLPAKITSRFPLAVRRRGESYFRDGRVRIVGVGPGSVEAEVRGTATYAVTLLQTPKALRLSCTCPVGAGTGVCKHVWAVLLQADTSVGIPGFEFDEDDADDFGDSPNDHVPYADVEDDPGRRVAGPQRPGRPASEQAGPAWARQLRAVDNMSAYDPLPERVAPWTDDQRLIYIVDAHATMHRQGGLIVELGMERRQRDGQWGPVRAFRANRATWFAAPDIRDREIAQMLVGTSGEYGYVSSGSSNRRFVIEPSAFDTTLRRMIETGRARLRVTPETAILPVTWDPGDPWEFRLRVTMTTADGRRGLRLAGVFTRAEGEELDLEAPSIIMRGGLLVVDDRVSRYHDRNVFALIYALRTSLRVEVTDGQALDLIEELQRLRHMPPLILPDELHVEQTSEAPECRLALVGAHQFGLGPPKADAEVTFVYGGSHAHPDDAARVFFERDTMRIRHRNDEAERAAMATLAQAGFKREYDYRRTRHVWRVAMSRAERAAIELTARGWRVTMDGLALREAGTYELELVEAIDWFELRGAVDFGGVSARLPELLGALHRGERRVALADGSLGIIPDALFDRLAGLAALATRGDESLRYRKAQAGILDAMLAALPEVRVDEAFARIREQLHRFHGIEPADAPPQFTGTLRPYQREGLGWLHFLRQFGFGGCLADDMGLGKTVQALALLASRRVEGAGPSLVVVPNSLVFNWQQEAARFAPSLRLLAYTGGDRTRALSRAGSYDLVITTYGTLRRDAPHLAKVTFDYVILDEAQAIKNPDTDSAKAARLLRANHRLAMSGTPVENRLAELWSLLEFLNPGLLGSASAFGRLTKATTSPRSEKVREPLYLGALARAVRPYILRRTKEEVAPDLPPKLEQTITVDLSRDDRRRYDELRDYYRASIMRGVGANGLARMQVQILEALLRLRQAACHPGLLAPDLVNASSSKLDVLERSLREIVTEGHKVLVFSQFTSLLAIVKPKLDAAEIVYEYLDGKTKDRQARVERFQGNPGCPVFLISLKAGGLGLNLTAADYVFLLDPWWNPAVESQAIDRTHRIGQTKSVFATRIIARDTVEEKVVELQERKRGLADAIVRADRGPMSTLTREDLELLLS
jgi:superfamily II DNA or RNA helicase